MKEFGEDNYSVTCIEMLCSNDLSSLYKQLDNSEVYWIKYYNSYEDGYNDTKGGQRDRKIYDECSCIAYDKQGNIIGKYLNFADASEKTGANRSCISKSCRSGNKFCLANNLIFRFIDDELTSNDMDIIKNKYPVIYQYSFDGELINSFDSLSSAARYLQKEYAAKCNSRDLSAVCKKDNASAYGYIWRKYPDTFETYSFRPQRYKVEQRDRYTGELINIYENCVDASIKTGIDASSINNVCNGNSYYHAGNYYWCFEGMFDKNKFNQKGSLIKAVDMFSLEGNYIMSFNSIKEANEHFGKDKYSSSITQACSGKHKTAFGYIWKYHVFY